jgi:hypothetical protein
MIPFSRGLFRRIVKRERQATQSLSELKSNRQQKWQVGGLCALEHFCSVDAYLIGHRGRVRRSQTLLATMLRSSQGGAPSNPLIRAENLVNACPVGRADAP